MASYQGMSTNYVVPEKKYVIGHTNNLHLKKNLTIIGVLYQKLLNFGKNSKFSNVLKTVNL
jgi:hypothetical protein